MATKTSKSNESFTTSGNDYGYGFSCSWENINSPGCYVLHHTGTLVRVPSDGLIPGRSPAITMVSNENWTVTKISDDPYVTRTKARLIAADMDICVNF